MGMKAFVVETSRSGPIEERVSRRAIARLSGRLIFAAIGFVLVVAALSACAERRPDETFTIGAMDIRVIDHRVLHTPEGRNGPVHDAITLAVKHVNDAGGVWGKPVDAVFKETFDMRPGERPVETANELIDEDGSIALIGPIRSVDAELIVKEVAKPRQVPIISFGTAPFVMGLDDDGFHFNTILNDEAQGFSLARVANDEHDEHVALAHLDTAWGRDLARVFKSHYNGRVSEVSLHPDDESFADELHELADSDAPVLVLVVLERHTHRVLDEVRSNDHFDHLLLIAEHRTVSLLEDYPEFLDGSKGVSPSSQHITEAEGHWETDFEAEYGYFPSASYAREAYDATVILALAAEMAGTTDGAAIRDAMYEISRSPGTKYNATANGIKAAMEAVRNGDDIDLEGEATAIDWDDRGAVTIGHFSVWQFKEGGIVDLEHFDVDLSE